MTVWGHWTLCGLCPGSTHLLYEICSLFVCWKTLFALEYSVWGWAVSDGHVHTYLRNHKTHSLQAPSCRLSMEAQLQYLLGSLHPSECKMGCKCTPSNPDLLIISTVRCCYWCYGSPAVEQIVTWGLAVWIRLKVSPETWDVSAGAACVKIFIVIDPSMNESLIWSKSLMCVLRPVNTKDHKCSNNAKDIVGLLNHSIYNRNKYIYKNSRVHTTTMIMNTEKLYRWNLFKDDFFQLMNDKNIENQSEFIPL